MRTWMFAISLGIGLAMVIPSLPDLAWMSITAAVFISFLPLLYGLVPLFTQAVHTRHLVSVVVFGLIIGLLWGVCFAHWRMSHVLPLDLEGQELWLEGEVVGLPTTGFMGRMAIRRFDFKIRTVEDENGKRLFNNTLISTSPKRVRLSWYAGPELSPGHKYRLKVRLKRPRSFANPGGFDYQIWLLGKGIDAQGYVRKDRANIMTEEAGSWLSVDRLRYRLRDRIQYFLANSEYRGVITALVIGDSSAISNEQWQLFSATGTNHLVAISGLHIGLIAVIGYFLCNQLVRRSTRFMMSMPAQNAGAIGAIIASLAYSALAGFSLPTSRACIMVTVLMGSRLLRRECRASSVFLFALLAVLLSNPLSLHSNGFWLSFGAVGALLFVFSARLGTGSVAQRWLLPQWVVFVALTPAILMFFNKLPWISPLANMLAIPVYSFLVVPLSLFGAAMTFISSSLAEHLFSAAATIVEIVSICLHSMLEQFNFIDKFPLAYMSPLTFVALGLGCVLLLCPRFLPGRWLALILLTFPWLIDKPQIPHGQFEIDVLDVGQGLSVVIQTNEHTLVYDTGAYYSSSFDLGKMVVQPFLESQGRHKINKLVISHNDNDHKGGMASLLNNMRIESLLSGEDLGVDTHPVQACNKGMRWEWDGVSFEVLHGGGSLAYKNNKKNNHSCVIRVRSNRYSVLLTGDVEKRIEQKLLAEYGESLHANILLAPHHGSNTSSSQHFIDRVDPDYVVFSAGYRNRFNHPSPKVVARYAQQGAKMINTAFAGAVHFSYNGNKDGFEVRLFRDENPHFWYAGDPFRVRL